MTPLVNNIQKPPPLSGIPNKQTSVAPHLLSQCMSSHILSGLCKITGYEVLRHGTSWASYKSIIKNGADLRKGGETTELSAGKYETVISSKRFDDGHLETTETIRLRTTKAAGVEAAQNHFYVFRDSEMGIASDGTWKMLPPHAPLARRWGPIIHSGLAYRAEYERAGVLMNLLRRISMVIKAIFTPKLKFIYSMKEIKGKNGTPGIFENDPDYGEEGAYRTSQPLPSNRIGLLGLFAHMKAHHAWKHLKSNPGRVALGIVQLAVGLLLTAIPGLGYIT